jgi:hypothetical protein
MRYTGETGTDVDPGGTRFTVSVRPEARYYRLSDGTEWVTTSISETASRLLIEFR